MDWATVRLEKRLSERARVQVSNGAEEKVASQIRKPVSAVLCPLFAALRSKHWIKNVLLFVPLLYSGGCFNISAVLYAIAGFIAFCSSASAIYLFNDIKDRNEDRLHPVKRNRPIAAGLLPVPLAACVAVGLTLVGLGLSFLLKQNFFYVVAGYIVLQILYTQYFKHIVILDVLSVASGFFARVIAGALLNEVAFSHWLITCTIMLSIFISLAKRRHEQVILGSEALNHRKILSEYSPYLLDQMIGVVTAATLISYVLYAVSPETVSKYHSYSLLATVPFVLYGIFRYLYLVHQKQLGGNPESILISDKPLLAAAGLWGVVSFFIIYVLK